MKPRALITYTHLSTFVKGDIELLEQNFKVSRYHFKNQPSPLLPLSLIKQFFVLLFTLPRYDIVYVWFGDYHSFLPALLSKLYRKKCYIVVGGYDICREKRYGYGSFSKPIRGAFTYSSMNMGHTLLAVSKNVERTLKAIVPTATIELLYNGINFSPNKGDYSPTKGDPSPLIKKGAKSSDILTVVLVSRVQTYYIKGLDRILAVARALPQLSFTLIGVSPSVFEEVGRQLPKNITVIEALPHKELLSLYKNYKIYLHLSRRESFSLSLAEALSQGLIPVVSAVGGMPEVVEGMLKVEGDITKPIYMSDSPTLKEEGIQNVVKRIEEIVKQSSSTKGEANEQFTHSGQEVNKQFTLTRRGEELYRILNK